MKLIHIQGNNCYHDCVITLANAFGLDYIQSFSRLWSESDLRYDPICRVFLTRRMPMALEDMGMQLEPPCVSDEERQTGWANIAVGDFVMVGMDAFLIPWTPLYELQNGPHYFIVRKGEADYQTCFDPTYGLNGDRLSMPELAAQAYALIPVREAAPVLTGEIANNPLRVQAREILETHPGTLTTFLEQAALWIHETGETALLPARYCDALLTGRLLYRHYLEERYPVCEESRLFQDKRYYEAWRAVKHGLYKASLTKRNPAAFEEACSRLTTLLEQEINLAKRLLSID